jgi:hypothetical protein
MPHKMYGELKDLGIDKKIILKWISNKSDGDVECIGLPHHRDK